MKRILMTVIAILLIAGFALPTRALAFQTTVINKTTNSWVWVTRYEFTGYNDTGRSLRQAPTSGPTPPTHGR